MEVLNDSPRKYPACPRYPVSRTKLEKDPSSPISNQITTAYYLSWHLLHTHTTSSVSFTRALFACHDYRSRDVATEIGRTLSTVHLDSVPVSSCRSKAQ